MRLRPMPVVMISSFTERGSEATLRALELRAVDFLAKPGSSLQIGEQAREIRERSLPPFMPASDLQCTCQYGRRPAPGAWGLCVAGARAARKGRPSQVPRRAGPRRSGGAIAPSRGLPPLCWSSTCRRCSFLRPPDGQPLRLRVKEAEHGERLMASTAIAPGHSHLKLGRLGTVMQCELSATRQ